MDCIVFIGTHKSGSSYDAISAAAGLGYFTVLLADKESQLDQAAEFPAVGLMLRCALDDPEHIRRGLGLLPEKGLKARAIVGFTEEHCHAASLMAKECGLRYFTPDAIKTMLNKLETRRAIQDSPYSPFFRAIDNKSELGRRDILEKLPFIMKNPVSAGSKEVYKVCAREECEAAFDEIRARRPEGPVLLEEFLDGPQFLAETLTVDKDVRVAAVVGQEISYDYRFIVTGYSVLTDRRGELYASVCAAAKDIVKLIGMENGPCHLEMRLVRGEWKLIEANPRISGGVMNTLIETAFGVNLVRETLKLALGRQPDLEPKHIKEAFAQYVTVQKAGILLRVTGRNRAAECEGVEHVYVKPRKGQLIIPPISMGQRYAYVVATGGTAERAAQNARYAAGQIRFYVN